MGDHEKRQTTDARTARFTYLMARQYIYIHAYTAFNPRLSLQLSQPPSTRTYTNRHKHKHTDLERRHRAAGGEDARAIVIAEQRAQLANDTLLCGVGQQCIAHLGIINKI